MNLCHIYRLTFCRFLSGAINGSCAALIRHNKRGGAKKEALRRWGWGSHKERYKSPSLSSAGGPDLCLILTEARGPGRRIDSQSGPISHGLLCRQSRHYDNTSRNGNFCPGASIKGGRRGGEGGPTPPRPCGRHPRSNGDAELCGTTLKDFSFHTGS